MTSLQKVYNLCDEVIIHANNIKFNSRKRKREEKKEDFLEVKKQKVIVRIRKIERKKRTLKFFSRNSVGKTRYSNNKFIKKRWNYNEKKTIDVAYQHYIKKYPRSQAIDKSYKSYIGKYGKYNRTELAIKMAIRRRISMMDC